MAANKDQPSLFEEGEGTLWKKEWQDMPEFIQDDLTPVKSILVHFETLDDMEKFSQVIGQKVFSTTRSIWFPEAEIGMYQNKRYR